MGCLLKINEELYYHTRYFSARQTGLSQELKVLLEVAEASRRRHEP